MLFIAFHQLVYKNDHIEVLVLHKTVNDVLFQFLYLYFIAHDTEGIVYAKLYSHIILNNAYADNLLVENYTS